MSVRRPGAPLRSPRNANRAALGDFLASERPVSVVGWLCMGPARYTSDVEFGGWSQSRSCPSAADESDFGVDSSVCLELSPLARLAAKVFLPPCQGIRAWLISIRLWLVLDDDDVDFDVINQANGVPDTVDAFMQRSLRLEVGSTGVHEVEAQAR